MSIKLSDFEMQVLRECAGIDPPSEWGAAVGAAIEVLRGRGFIDKRNLPTGKGEDIIYQDIMP